MMMMILESVVQVAPVMTAHTAPASFGKSVPVCVTGSTDRRSGVGLKTRFLREGERYPVLPHP